MPTYEEKKDLEIGHRANAAGAMRTEVWTLKDFNAGELKFAPWTTGIKDRLYTNGLSVHLDLAKNTLLGNRVLALDGRARSHLAHPNQRAHVPPAVGSLFWAITRVAARKDANLSLAFASVTAPAVRIAVPGGADKSGWKHNVVTTPAPELPKIPLLVNPKPVKQFTLLTCVDDPVVAEAREAEKKEAKAKRAGQGEETKPNKKAKV